MNSYEYEGIAFRYNTKVKDGFDGDVLKNEVKLLVEAMGTVAGLC